MVMPDEQAHGLMLMKHGGFTVIVFCVCVFKLVSGGYISDLYNERMGLSYCMYI